MIIDAIVLAGGRSRRLGEVPKARLELRGRTLLEHAVEAVHFARVSVVVGGEPDNLPTGVFTAREEPPFQGPAAGVAAGLDRISGLHREPSDFTFVLACDMPAAAVATAAIRVALENHSVSDGVIAVDDDGHPQPLAAAYRTLGLVSAIEEQRRLSRLNGLSMFRLIANLSLTPFTVQPGSTDDVDTWDDAERFGIIRPLEMENHDRSD